MIKNGNDYDIVVTRSKAGRPDMDVLSNLYVNNQQGAVVPLNQVASLKLEQSPVNINHHEKQRVVAVKAFVKKRFPGRQDYQ